MEVYSSKHERLVLEDDAFSSGGEGEVRKVIVAPSRFSGVCVKLYYQKKRTAQQENKIKYMVLNPPPIVVGNGFLIGWPLDYVTDERGHFLGFIMPLAYPDSKQLIMLTAPKLSKKLGAEWFARYDRARGKYALISRLKLMNNIAVPIHILHSTQKYVLKDFKPENVLITHDGKVTVVDMDSVQISEGSKLLFPGTAATPNYIPPEFYSKGVGKNADIPLNESWDNFAVGVVFYQILFGLHPYVVTPLFQKDSNCSEIFQNIEQNLFPFGPNGKKIKSYPPLHRKFEVLPPQLRQLFLNAFSSTESIRPGTDEWGRIIHGLVLAAGPVSAPQQVPQTEPRRKPMPGPKPEPKQEPRPAPSPVQTTKESKIWIGFLLTMVIIAVIGFIIFVFCI